MITLILLALSTGCDNGKEPPASAPESQESAAGQSEPEAGLYAEYLTVADVEEVTGMSGLTMKEEAVTLEFYNGDGVSILEARFYGSDFYEAEVGANEEYYTPLSDLGDKAAICIPDMPYRVTFLQGEHAVMVQTISQGSDLPVSEEQLIALAKIVSSRL